MKRDNEAKGGCGEANLIMRDGMLGERQET
jgi:hypothetical protein